MPNLKQWKPKRKNPRTHCLVGHELTEGNILFIREKDGTVTGRSCRECRRNYKVAYRNKIISEIGIEEYLARRREAHKKYRKNAKKKDPEKYYAREKMLHKKYSQTEHGRKQIIAKDTRAQKRHPQKTSARTKLRYAVKHGKIVKLPCQTCGDVKSEGHHENYNKPLDVIWLCSKHHHDLHKARRLSLTKEE